jgi:hypothetical protein
LDDLSFYLFFRWKALIFAALPLFIVFRGNVWRSFNHPHHFPLDLLFCSTAAAAV